MYEFLEWLAANEEALKTVGSMAGLLAGAVTGVWAAWKTACRAGRALRTAYAWATTPAPTPPPEPLSDLAAALVEELEGGGWRLEYKNAHAGVARGKTWACAAGLHVLVAGRDVMALLDEREQAAVKSAAVTCMARVAKQDEDAARLAALDVLTTKDDVAKPYDGRQYTTVTVPIDVSGRMPQQTRPPLREGNSNRPA